MTINHDEVFDSVRTIKRLLSIIDAYDLALIHDAATINLNEHFDDNLLEALRKFATIVYIASNIKED